MMKTGPISRFNLVGGALSIAGLFIFIWMIRIQLSPSAQQIKENAKWHYQYTLKTFYPERGNIYDRWGHLMAGNQEVYELGADLRYVRDPQTIATTLASVLGLDSQKVYASLTLEGDNNLPRYVVLANSVDPKKINELREIKTDYDDAIEAEEDAKRAKAMPTLDGLMWTAYLQRSYPEHELGSNLLGFYSYLDRNGGRGYFGVEENYNHLLAGQPVQRLVPIDPYLIEEAPEIPPGISLVLTIDREIQAMAERIVDESVQENGAVAGTILIMDPRNGDILAIATTPRMDPNEYWEYGEKFPDPIPYNRAIGQTYEPGSVFKVLTMAAGIDAGAVTPETSFLDTGVINVGGVPIYNWDRGAWGPQTMTGCMQHSLNVCLAWVATQMGPTTFYNYMQAFGLGHRTGVDLSGEVTWPLSVAGDSNWYPVNLGTNSFGQGLAATPIQMIAAVSSVANTEGKLMMPRVLKATIENGEQYNNPPMVIGSPISPQTSRTMSEMLAQSLETEASEALVEGYRVAGKTGTGEIPTPDGYATNLTNTSFVGWGPVDDPRFVVYVWLEKPTSSMWGSVVASPIFREVVEELVVLLDLPPDAIRQQLENQQVQASQ